MIQVWNWSYLTIVSILTFDFVRHCALFTQGLLAVESELNISDRGLTFITFYKIL